MTETWTRGLMPDLTEGECRQLVETRSVGRLAFVDDGGPAVLPVNNVAQTPGGVCSESPRMPRSAGTSGAWSSGSRSTTSTRQLGPAGACCCAAGPASSIPKTGSPASILGVDIGLTIFVANIAPVAPTVLLTSRFGTFGPDQHP
jgi:hypothetical protein